MVENKQIEQRYRPSRERLEIMINRENFDERERIFYLFIMRQADGLFGP